MKMLDPRSIQHKKFRETRLSTGYDQDEVDSFLDECESTITELTRNVGELQAQLAHAQAGVGLAGIEKLLTVAQQQADQTVADANHQASLLVAEAQTKANTILGQAYNKADEVSNDAQEKANAKLAMADATGQEMVIRATAQRDQLLNHADQLAGARDDILAKLQAALGQVAPTTLVIASEAETTVLPAVVDNNEGAAQ